MYALLDTGSQHDMIREALVIEAGLEMTGKTTRVRSFTGEEILSQGTVSMTLTLRSNQVTNTDVLVFPNLITDVIIGNHTLRCCGTSLMLPNRTENETLVADNNRKASVSKQQKKTSGLEKKRAKKTVRR